MTEHGWRGSFLIGRGTKWRPQAFGYVAMIEHARSEPIDDDDAVVVSTLDTATFDGFFVAHHANIVRAHTMALGDTELGRDAASEGFARALQRWRKALSTRTPQDGCIASA